MSAKISITETDFTLVVRAAIDAQREGCDEDANALDKLARRMNLALSNESIRGPWLPQAGKRSWKDMPSVLDVPGAQPPTPAGENTG